jgi:hypothetical protein
MKNNNKLNILLIAAIAIVYYFIFFTGDGLLSSTPDDDPALAQQALPDTIMVAPEAVEYRFDRNFFVPFRYRPAQKTNSKKTPKPAPVRRIQRTDTLAVLDSDGKTVYLLREGSKIWIK